MNFSFRLVCLIQGLIFSWTIFGSILHPRLNDSQITQISDLLNRKEKYKNLEAAERNYQTLVQPQILTDLIEFYSEARIPQQKITYASFTPESMAGHGSDLGSGLHVVKRLTIPLTNSTSKIIDVNEHWPEDRRTGGLFFPDEIRIKTLVFEGKRKVVGSEKLYLFDLLRLAWDESGKVKISRRTRYTFDPNTQKNHQKQMRSPVASPYSCISCHRSPNKIHENFLKTKDTPNFETIVQDSYFEKPLDSTFGFQEYLDHLRQSGRTLEFIKEVKSQLQIPEHSMKVPGLYEELKNVLERGEFNWLPADEPFIYQCEMDRQGVYQAHSGLWFLDAIENIFEGKYRWWFPIPAIP